MAISFARQHREEEELVHTVRALKAQNIQIFMQSMIIMVNYETCSRTRYPLDVPRIKLFLDRRKSMSVFGLLQPISRGPSLRLTPPILFVDAPYKGPFEYVGLSKLRATRYAS